MRDMQSHLKKQLRNSSWVASLQKLRNSRDEFSQGRPLSVEEIQQLEKQGNSSESWSRVHVLGSTRLTSVRLSHFSGDILLTGFSDQPIGPPYLRLEPGISRCRLRDCIVGNACLSDVAFLNAQVIEDEAIVMNAGSVTCNHPALFGLGKAIHPGSETGTRSIWLWDGMDLDFCRQSIRMTPAEQTSLGALMRESFEELRSDFGFIGKGALIQSVPVVENVWVGAGARIRGALRLTDATLVSAPEESVAVSAGAIVENALLQPGSAVESGGQVYDSVLLEHSQVMQQGIVSQSVIGPNTQVAKGEITASLVGPFVGFHHQALLIGALWPEGRGNIGYGANVGSNHTGKKPDQEIAPGEGNFFGLACSVKFPANFKDAPFSLFATGVTTLPQRLAFPFSLVNPPAETRHNLPPALNEIFPGWMWADNAYALFRNAYKFKDRNKARRHHFDENFFAPKLKETVFSQARLFAPETVTKVANAMGALQNASLQEGFYLESHIPGLGKNYCEEKNRWRGIDAYTDYLAVYLLLHFASGGNGLNDIDRRHIQSLLGEITEPAEFVWEHRKRLADLDRRVRASLEKDAQRGGRIFEDYADFHPGEDPVLKALSEDLAAVSAALDAKFT